MDASSRTSSKMANEGQSDGLTLRPRNTSSVVRHTDGFGRPEPVFGRTSNNNRVDLARFQPSKSYSSGNSVHCAPPTLPRASRISSWTPKYASSKLF